jgi:hypothetical protein
VGNRGLESVGRWVRMMVAVLSAVVAMAAAAPAQAFDRGPHNELTEAAMRAEGFGPDAIGVAQVENWFVDLYHELSAIRMPSSGHAGFWKQALVGIVRPEDWPRAVVDAATRSHFDDNPGAPMEARMPSLVDTAGLTAEWARLRSAVFTLVQEAREENDPEKLIEVLGMSLHPVQDFPSHTNWIEPQNGTVVPGTDGPGWRGRGYGSNPTWFDVPAEVRNSVDLYGDATAGHRPHGNWDADGNKSLTTAMNKDWPGRPLNDSAQITAYFGSRQWIEAVRSWVHDEAFWARAQDYRADRGQLRHDQTGMHEIMLYSGHWQGQGEPMGGLSHGVGGSLLDLRQAVKNYFQPSSKLEIVGGILGGGPSSPGNIIGAGVGDSFNRAKTKYRARFERLILRMAERNPTGEVGPVPSSQGIQRSTQFVALRITKLDGEGLGDPGPDDADMYANVRIDGQPMNSSVIHGHDHFSFPDPYEPFTWIKAVPSAPEEETPVESIDLSVKTANVRWAGTDDDVYLRLGPNLRFPLDKRMYNDFERNDLDNYSVPIDEAVKNGVRIADITEVAIEKAGDGPAGGWKLGGMKMKVNGQLFYNDQHINRWLEDDHRRWKAADFERRSPSGTAIPVWINLREDDLLYGGDDEGDINPFGHRRTVAIGYTPGATLIGTTKGGNQYGGRRGDGGEASIAYRIETIKPEPMPGNPPPPPPVVKEGQPDLVITAFDFSAVTVVNKGKGRAGPFRLRAGNGSREDAISFTGLAPGASETRPFTQLTCEGVYEATVDDQRQVDESDETNNTKTSQPVLC